ncbi:MAG: hypothetical protein NW206_07225 [Hyphomonadaceae bacterium]|nr:hypothetical protein [Hyphomonadaceae bacterium]
MKLRMFALGAMLATALPGLASAQIPLGAPVETTPIAPPPQQEPAPQGSPQVSHWGPAIESTELSQLNAWTVGTLTREQGGLPSTAWAQSDPAALAAAFGALPSVYQSPAVQTLARRVLLSGAEAPPGDAAEAARKRFEALGRMGAADELSQMAAGAGPALADPAIAQYAAQAELARNRRVEACARGRLAQGDPPATFILRLRAYCSAAIGDRAAADLALEIARANRGEDAWVTSVVGIVGGAPTSRPPSARYDTSLNAALSLAANLRPPANALTGASTLALLAVARNEEAAQPLRAQAAAAALQRGVLPATEARAILAATPANVTTGVPAYVNALRTMSTSRGAPVAVAVASVLRTARTPAEFAAAARFFADDITAFASWSAPTPATAAAPDAAPQLDSGNALLFARAAIATGDARLAARFLDLAMQGGAAQAGFSPVEAALIVMRGPNADPNGMAVHRRMDGSTTATARTTARDILIMGAVGFQFDGAAQAFATAHAPQGGAAADAGALAILNAAAERGASGEALLYAAIAAGNGPATLDANSVLAIIRALRAARMDGEARRFAVEAILAGGPA